MRLFVYFSLFLLLSGPAMATVTDFTVSGIAIDQPTTDATAARDEALETALKKAYDELRTSRMSMGETLPPVESAPLWKLMQDFEVADERISASRYIGTFTIRFRSHALADASTQAAAAAETAAGPVPAQPAVFRFTNLMEWQSARNALKNTVGVKSTNVSGFRRNQVDLQIMYSGPVDAVVKGLNAQGFSVSTQPGDSNIWYLALHQ